MIAPLRRRHRVMTTTLLIAVAVFYLLALWARPDEPRMAALPREFSELPVTERLLVERDDLFVQHPIVVRLLASVEGLVLELEPRSPVLRPEVLVYWTPAAAGERSEETLLVGSLSGARPRAFVLPAAASGGGGQLVLYSLGHLETLATAELPAVEPIPSPERRLP